jgi:hypothetical protein
MADGSLGDRVRIAIDPATGVVITPVSTTAVSELTATHEAELTQLLHEHGALLFRGWAVRTAEEFRDAVAAMWSAAWAEYREPGTPRSPVIDNVSTSTEYDAASPIHLHNENSHVITWPERLFFWCDQPAATGGATPIADMREILRRVPDALRSRVEDHGVLYQWSFGYGLGFSWQQVFETEDPAVAEDYFRRNGMTWEWEGRPCDRRLARRLRRSQVRERIRGARGGEVERVQPVCREVLDCDAGAEPVLDGELGEHPRDDVVLHGHSGRVEDRKLLAQPGPARGVAH